MKNLTKPLFIICLIILIAIIDGCKKEPVVPTLITTPATAITLNSATTGGYVSNDGGARITAKGVCWSTTLNPTTGSNITSDGTGTGIFVSSLTELTEGTTYYVRAYATNKAGTAYGNQQTFTTTQVVPPTLTTTAVTAITLTTATSGGNISNDGNGSITARGVCWSTTQNPTTANSLTSDGTGTGSFVSNITGLSPGTTYYLRAYATNSSGTGYGAQQSFITTQLIVPTLTTATVTAITLTTATSGGSISNDGGSAITVKGICWSTTQNPTTANNFTTNGTGMGSFVSNMTGLLPGTTYYVRAYATNSTGTGYGTQQSFITSPVAVPTLTTTVVSAITSTTATSGGNISNDGGGAITARGVCWGTAQDPTTANSLTTGGTGTGIFVSNMISLTPGTTYYVRAYATNSAGTAYGNQQTFNTSSVVVPTLTTTAASAISLTTATSGGNISSDGGGTITVRGVCWSTAQDPTTAGSLTNNGTGTGIFVSNLTNLLPGTTYYVRAYATNSAGTAYGPQQSFSTLPVGAPTLITTVVSGLTSIAATSGGNISNDGGGAITARGVCWNTEQDPTTANSLTTDGAGTGIFVSSITGLTNGVTYYLRAYATNSAGTFYGNQISFITPVTDIEGNVYKTVKIGNQTWMAENLKTTKYNDNSIIPIITGNAEWAADTVLELPAYCWFNNEIANKDIYGAIYNWYTVGTGKLCMTGWHAPTDAEYNTMELSLGMPPAEVNLWGWQGTDQGTQLKSTTGWTGGGNGSNTSGFTALPGGYRIWSTGNSWGTGIIAYFWTSSDDAINGNPGLGWYRRLDGNILDPITSVDLGLGPQVHIYKATTRKAGGKYVRCVKD